MATISLTDVIFATITLRGRISNRIQLCGVSSFSDILARLLPTVPGGRGLATVDIRNGSQGWSARRSVMLG